MNNQNDFISAIVRGDQQSFDELLPLINPKHDNSIALAHAARQGNVYMVSVLIPLSNPKDRSSQALLLAARQSHWDVVKLLIPVSDPKKNESEPLQRAILKGNQDIIDLLYPVSDIKRVLKIIPQSWYSPSVQQCLDQLQQRWQSECETKHINNHIKTKNKPTTLKRKI